MSAYNDHTAFDMARSASRTGSISTLWSSADVPFFLDSRVGGMSQVACGSSLASKFGSVSRFSRRTSSIELGRPSLSLGDDTFNADSFYTFPPRGAGPIRRNPSISIESVHDSVYDESPPRPSPRLNSARSSPRSATQKCRLQGMVSSCAGESPGRDFYAPDMPASVSSGSGLTQAGRSSGASSPVVPFHEESLYRPMLSLHPAVPPTQQLISATNHVVAPPRLPSHLYTEANRYFEPNYTMEAEPDERQRLRAERHLSPLGGLLPPVDPTLDYSRGGSIPSSSQSHHSGRTSSGDSSVLDEPAEPIIDFTPGAPTRMDFDARLRQSDNTPTQEYPNKMALADQSKEMPSLPSLPSFNSGLSGSPRGFASRHAARPKTAENELSDDPPVHSSPRRNLKGPPTPLKIEPTTSQAAMMSSSERTLGSTSQSNLLSNVNRTGPLPGKSRPSTVGSKLRARALSTSKLRPTSPWKLFGADVPAMPTRLPDAFAHRPSTAQVDGEEPKMKGRFRSRTLGESDRTVSLQVPPRVPPRAEEVDAEIAARQQQMRRPSRSETLASSVASSARSFLLPRSSNFNVNSSPIASALLTPKSPARSKAKSGTGWASYLSAGLTLHIDQEGHRSTQISISYLSYDPFGRPEDLVNGAETRLSTPKQPKSRGDSTESDQVGTLEFGQGDEIHQQLWPFHSSRTGASPVLKHLTIGDDTKADLLTRQAALSVRSNGVHEVSGYERKGQLAWKFIYRVEDLSSSSDKNLIPVSFSCSATLLDPTRARKSRILTMVRKQMVPSLVSNPVSLRQPSYGADSISSGPSQASLREVQKKASVGRGSSFAEGAVTASPASARQRLDSAFLANQFAMTSGGNLSHVPLSATSISSADSSSVSCSQPPTPASFRGVAEQVRLQVSPVSLKFGRVNPNVDSDLGQLGVTGVGSAVRQTSLTLQDKANDISPLRPLQTGPPRMIGGRKLIPISLPPELQRKTRIDPAQLVQAKPIRPTPKVIPAIEERKPSGRRRSNTATNRPPTTSETIKLEYLARETTLRPQKSHGNFITTPVTFARRPSHSSDAHRPFTADAWGAAIYPPADAVSGTISGHRGDSDEFYRPLPLPPRKGRPRTATTDQRSSANAPAALIDFSPPRINV